jgi:O-antigen ligase
MPALRVHLLYYSITGMMASMLFSRALLSIFMAVFILAAFFHKDIRGHIRHFFSSPLLWSMSLLFILPLISGVWSEDKKEWLSVLRLKLPLLLLPLAFAAPFSFSKKQWDVLAYIFTGIVTAGTIWSLFYYAGDIEAVNASYLKAKSIITPMGNDHIRFSWLVSIAVLLCGWMVWKGKNGNKKYLVIFIITGIWLVVYLHLLAARTGLFSLYIMLFITGALLVVRKARLVTGISFLLLLVLLPLMAYNFLPSFQNRTKYIMWDYGYFKEMHYLPGGNDAARVISMRAGWNIFEKNPLYGIGAGDITAATGKWDKEYYPGILESDILYPSSEWLVYGLIAGWPGILLFTVIMLVPFFTRHNNNLAWWLLHITAAAGFIFDVGLEVQFGVFIYTFIVLWWWKWLDFLPLMND